MAGTQQAVIEPLAIKLVDWSRGDLYHSLSLQLVDPVNLTDIRGEVSDVCGGTLDWDYYGDTRGGAKVETAGDPWDGSSAVRLLHTVSAWEGELATEILFTGYVTGIDHGEGTTAYTLASTMRGLEAHVTPGGYTISKSSKAKEVLADVMKRTGRRYRFTADATDYLYGGAVVEEAGTDYLSVAFGVCDKADDRLTVDADGTVRIEKYKRPALRTPDWEEDASDPRTMVVGVPEFSDNGLERPARVIVHAEKDEKTITVGAEVQRGDAAHGAVRGYTLDSFHDENDLSPFTKAAAQTLAGQYLARESELDLRCKHGLMYRPLREGMVERLTYGGETRRWQVASASLDLNTWIWDLELKGGWQ